GLPVVHRHRLAGLAQLDVDPHLWEVRITPEVAVRPAARAIAPGGRGRVHQEPGLVLGDETMLGRFQASFGDHAGSLPHPSPRRNPQPICTSRRIESGRARNAIEGDTMTVVHISRGGGMTQETYEQVSAEMGTEQD